ncbi:MAG: PQQ-binding-like beta-propeller repeat protein [Haloarculaceae archaeon]
MDSDDDLAPYQGSPLPSSRTTRRALLAGAAALGVGGLASQVGLGPIEARSPPGNAWPQRDYDPAGTAHNPAATAPSDPDVDWRRRVVDPPAAAGVDSVVGPEAVFVAGTEVVAVDRTDGRELWRDGVPGGPLALGDGRLFVGSWGLGRLRALSTDGEETWEESSPIQGMDALVYAGDRLYVATDSGLYTHDAGDGAPLWASERDAGGGVVVAAGRLHAAALELTSFATRSLLDTALGSPPAAAWESQVTPSGLVGTPQGLVTGVGQRDRDEVGGASLVARAPDTGEVRWRGRADIGGEFSVGPLAATGDRCLAALEAGAGTRNAVSSYRLEDGERDWRYRLDHRVTDIAAVDGAVILGTEPGGEGSSDAGSVRALDAGDGEELWRAALWPGEGCAGVAPVDGAVFAWTESGEVAALR